jgi:periplasmic protein TonB
MDQREKKNKSIGAAVSVGLHLLVLLAFLFIMAWKAPNPPAPEIGIELNFGTDLAGFGEEQPQTPSPEPQPVQNQVAESQQAQSQPEPVQQPVVTPDVAKPTPTEAPVTKAVTQPEPSPVAQQEEVKPKPQPKQQQQEVEKPKETVKPALFPGEKEKESSATKAGATSQGDQPNKTGDQGDEKGKVESKALYGEQGGGNNGPQLSIVGWTWDSMPRDADTSTENGRVVIDFVIDDRGYVQSAIISQSTVSLGVAQFYKRQVENLSFSRTAAGIVPQQTKGSVTFIIKSR